MFLSFFLSSQAEIPEVINEVLKRKRGSRKKYSAELRSFALTLNFFSPKAYNYARNKFRNLLPDSSTIRKWYSVVNGKPGFTNEILCALACKVRNTEAPVLCNLVIDEVAIRQQIVYDGNRYYGYVDLGVNSNTADVDNSPQAKNALVFMLVSLNDHWKVPIGYFLIDSLGGEERASLLNKSLELIYDTGVIVHSLTFDGASVNFSMCTNLGANFELGETFKPYITHPVTKEKVFCFLDPCHALKLVRNTLGEKLILRCNEKKIYWDDIVSLQKIEGREGLKAATKLTIKHIKFKNSKMNVKLAAQTLSQSVSSALKFANQYFPMHFNDSEATALFCSFFNDAFDLLNVRSRFCKRNKCNVALTNDNFNDLKNYAFNIIDYIKKITDNTNLPILLSNRKTGFLGFIICLTNMFDLFNILKEKGLIYLLTYKLNQDHLETFFSALRSRGGFNNNPNAKQFENAYKRLLVRHEIVASEKGNCLINDVQILYVSSAKKKNTTDGLFNDVDDINLSIDSFDQLYFSTLCVVTPYVDDVVKYISGFVIRKLLGKICHICATFVTTNSTDSLLINLKNRGNLIYPSADVIKITKYCEKIIRANNHTIRTTNNIKAVLVNKIFYEVCDSVFNDCAMTKHIMDQNLLDNHKIELVKTIIELYINLRLHHEAKCATNLIEKKHIRHKFTKLIHFVHE